VHTTRFAPSPTGPLHLGHAFAAITASEAAAGGRFLLRIEDLDATRVRAEFSVAIEEDLAWLGLSWTRPVMRQSERFDAYGRALSTLLQRELAYPCFCTRKEIAAEIVRAMEAPHQPEETLYPGTCRSLSAADRQRHMACGRPYAMRLDSSKAALQIAPLTFTELGTGPDGERGVIAVNPTLLGDIVLARKDVPASYHLAVVVDDAFQGVTLVTRGNDLFGATHVQRLLQALLAIPAPLYAHHRLVVDAQGRRLSKRNNAVTLRNLRQQGMDGPQVRRTLGLQASISV
jgi:glutamyl-Q tRNA(Asp) synthetase